MALIWNKPEKNQRTVKGILKMTYYRKFDTSGVLANAAKGIPKINIFWKNKKFLNRFAVVLQMVEIDENSILSERIHNFDVTFSGIERHLQSSSTTDNVLSMNISYN
ncbi:hypothetical protein Glove_365g47 [Diversispora epigaea]|uniref:Uncharacterized protein n=1 Tax=Diversispora epigaea TaxID=1348612 RepID=A0A397H7S4_9GLOM|nr:hypothetical protein Glove_365g47 [Diversispora epigaea]